MVRVLLMFVVPLIAFSQSVRAQDAVPQLPAPIQNLVDEGAQIRFLGKDHGFDAWLTIKNGQEQYFYVKPDRSAFLMGVLFDESGDMITVDQVQRLRGGEDDLLDALTGDEISRESSATARNEAFEFQSPSERLFYDIENSNWVGLGSSSAPIMYSFIDPQCPHCHKLIENMRDEYLDKGRVELRMIPVGFREETRAQAAFLMATPNPQERWYKHMNGDKDALPAKAELNQQGVQRNLAIMQSWKFDVTPMIVYRDRAGSVKIVRGQPKDLPALIADIGGRS